VGRRCVELIHPEDLDRTLTESTEGVSGENELLAFENRYRHRDGSYRWLAWNARSFEDDVIYAVARDVTEAKAKEDALAISHERSRLLADLGLRALEQLDLQAVLDHACATVADSLGVDFCDLPE